MTIGMVIDMYTESSNDKDGDYQEIANQDDFDSF